MSGPPTFCPERAAVGEELLRATLARGETVQLPVIGSSMTPTLEPGDTVLIAALDGLPRLGEVVLIAGHGGAPAVHRVVAVRSRGPEALFISAGDAGGLDRVMSTAHVLGRATAALRDGKAVALPSRTIGGVRGLRARWRLALHGLGAWRALGRGLTRSTMALLRRIRGLVSRRGGL
jgi:hypothetical protein